MSSNTVRAFTPLLLSIAVMLVLCGAALALCFGYIAWEVLYKPDNVTMVTFLLKQVADTTNTPALTGTMSNGQTVAYNMSPSVRSFGLCYLFLMGVGVLVSIARCMSDIGVHIIKVLWPAPQPQKKAMPPQGAARPKTAAPPAGQTTAI